MTIRYGWIGKGIAVALGAVALALALPPEANGEPFPFPARLLASTLLLAAVFAIYEVLGYSFGRVIARSFPEDPGVACASAELTATLSLRAATAVLVFAAYLGAQLIALVIVDVVAILSGAGVYVTVALNDPRSAPWLAATILAGMVGGAALSLALTLRYGRDVLRARGPLAIGYVPVERRVLVQAGLAAAVFGGLYLLLAPHLAAPDSSADLGPFVQLTKAGGWPRFAGAFAAVVLAPPLEEFLFRGVLLAGLARSWGVPVAGLLVTLLFVAWHLPYAARYWPAALAITLMALFLLATRLRTGSILPGIAAHFAYNAVLVMAMYLGSPSSRAA